MSLTTRGEHDLTELEQALVAELEQVLPQLQADRFIPAMSVAVSHGGRTIWEAGSGLADIASGTQATPDTVYRSGSMGKTYTATAIMQLVEQGRIALNARVSDLVGFDVINAVDNQHITVENLLTHRSGLTTNGAASRLDKPVPLETYLRELVSGGKHDFFKGVLPKWSTPTGQAMQYSNTGMGLLGLVVEKNNAQGLSYGHYILQSIIQPLGMVSARYPDGDYRDPAQVPEDIQSRYATGYAGFGPSNIVSPDLYFNEFPAGLIITTAGDHLRVLQAYLNGGQFNGSALLKAETIAQMLEPRVGFGAAADGSRPIESDVGLAWMSGRHGTDTEWFGHGGAHMWGFHNDYRAFPKLGLAVAAFSNRWDLPATQNTYAVAHPTTTIADHAAQWLAANRDTLTTQYSLGYRRAYSMGLTIAMCTKAYLGAPGDWDPAYADLAASASQLDGPYDMQGFKDAINDADQTDYTIESLVQFLDSPACRVSKTELERIWAGYHAGGGLPLPASAAILAAVAGGAGQST